jgi:glycosyltransferase involved in cell wall biosynthesis
VILGIDASRLVGDRTGVGRCLEGVIQAWTRQDLPFEAVHVFSHKAIADLPDHERLIPKVLPGRSGGAAWEALQLRPALGGCDILFAPYVVPLGYSGRSVVWNLGILEGDRALPGPRARARSWHAAYSARRASRVIANSESTKNDLENAYGIGAEKIDVIWLGVDVGGTFRPPRDDDRDLIAAEAERQIGSRSPYFLYVGKISSRRNVPALLTAFATVHARQPDVRLLIVGPVTSGPDPAGTIAELGLASHVRHVPYLGHDQLARLYQGARGFVLPTEHEGFSCTILEALASGCPVITVRHASLVESGLDRTTITLEDAQPDGLATAMLRLATDDSFRTALASAGPEAVRALGWETCAARIAEVLVHAAAHGSA